MSHWKNSGDEPLREDLGPSTPKASERGWIAAAVVLAICSIVVAAAVGLASRKSSSQPTYRDPVTLANSITALASVRVNNPSDPGYIVGDQVAGTVCVQATTSTFACNVHLVGLYPQDIAIVATVATDGRSWVSTNR